MDHLFEISAAIVGLTIGGGAFILLWKFLR